MQLNYVSGFANPLRARSRRLMQLKPHCVNWSETANWSLMQLDPVLKSPMDFG